MARGMKNYREVLALLDKVGAVWLRGKKHNVFRLPDGKRFVIPVSGSPSGAKNDLARLKRWVATGEFR